MPLGACDANCYNDHELNPCNIMAGMVYDKCSEEVLREKFQRRMPKQWSRYRSRLVKVLDNYYFQELPPEELKRALDKAIVRRDDIKTWDDVSKCCEEI